jgi:hypothetical protein
MSVSNGKKGRLSLVPIYVCLAVIFFSLFATSCETKVKVNEKPAELQIPVHSLILSEFEEQLELDSIEFTLRETSRFQINSDEQSQLCEKYLKFGSLTTSEWRQLLLNRNGLETKAITANEFYKRFALKTLSRRDSRRLKKYGLFVGTTVKHSIHIPWSLSEIDENLTLLKSQKIGNVIEYSFDPDQEKSIAKMKCKLDHTNCVYAIEFEFQSKN